MVSFKFLLSFLAVIGMHPLSHAQTNIATANICDDLYTVACSHGGVTEDPTGQVTWRFDVDSNEDLKIFDKNRATYIDKAKSSLKENGHFKALVAHMSRSLHPQCNVDLSNKAESQQVMGQCEGLLANVLVDLLRRDLIKEAPELSSKIDIKDAQTIRHHLLYSQISDEIVSEFKSKAINAKQLEKVKNKLDPTTRRLIGQVLSRNSNKDARKMVIRATGVSWGGNICEGSAPLTAFLEENGYYYSGSEKYYYCNGYMRLNTSEMHAVYSIAHEITHSVDPCVIFQGPPTVAVQFRKNKQEEDYPIENLTSCLRQSSSVGAQKKPGTKQEDLCYDDQLKEAVADYVGLEVLIEYIKETYPRWTPEQWRSAIINTIRPECRRSKSDGEWTAHLHPEQTANKLILAHPYIREKMGCAPLSGSKKYCATSISLPNVKNKKLSSGGRVQ